MKQCPINKDLDCEECRMNFGPKKCGIFSLAADMSYLIELIEKLVVLLEKRLIKKEG
mgnify:FL=1